MGVTDVNRAQALHQFWSSFTSGENSVPAYDESTVPDDKDIAEPKYPRITYTVATGEFEQPVMLSASLWDYSTSWETLSLLEQDIFNAIGYGGKLLPFTGGKIWIKRGNPFAQRMSDENKMVRRIYINVEAEYFET